MQAAIRSAEAFSHKTVAILKDATESQQQILVKSSNAMLAGMRSYYQQMEQEGVKFSARQQQIMQSVGGKDAAAQHELELMKSFYEQQAAEAQKLRQTNYSREETQIRAVMTLKIKALRQEAAEARILAEVNRRLGLGDPTGTGVIRQTNYSSFEQQVRNAMAVKTRAMKDEALQTKVLEEANRRLFGNALRPVNRSEEQQQLRDRLARQLRETRRIQKEQASIVQGDWMDELKGMAGKHSVMGKVLDLVRGGGAIGAVAVGASMFNELSKRVEELSLSYAKGELSGRELTGEILRSIPIVGQAGDALARFWGLASGETLQVAQIQQYASIIETVTDLMQRKLVLFQNITRESGRFIEDLQRKMQRMDLGGLAGSTHDAQSGYIARQREIADRKKGWDNSEEYKQMEEDLKKARAWQQTQNARLASARNAANGAHMSLGADQGTWETDQAYMQRVLRDAQGADALAEAARKHMDDARKKIEGSAGDEGMASLQLRNKEMFAAARNSAWEWINSTLVEPLDKGAKLLEEKRRQMREGMAKIIGDLRRMRMGNVEGQVEEFRATGAGDEQIRQFKQKAEAIDELSRALERLGRINTGSALGDYGETMRQLQQLYGQGKISEGKFLEMRRSAMDKMDQTLGEQARNLKESLLTPQEKYQKELEKLQTLRDMVNPETGERYLSQQEYDQAERKLRKDTLGETKAPGLASYIASGSADAMKYRYELQMMAGGNAGDTQKQQLEVSKKSRDYLQTIASKAATTVYDIGDLA